MWYLHKKIVFIRILLWICSDHDECMRWWWQMCDHDWQLMQCYNNLILQMFVVIILQQGQKKGGTMGLKPHLNWLGWGLALPQLYTIFCIAESPDLQLSGYSLSINYLKCLHIAQSIIIKSSEATMPCTINRLIGSCII